MRMSVWVLNFKSGLLISWGIMNEDNIILKKKIEVCPGKVICESVTISLDTKYIIKTSSKHHKRADASNYLPTHWTEITFSIVSGWL